MIQTKPKPCKHCFAPTHFSFQCHSQRIPLKPASKPIKQRGKVAKKWAETRAAWFKEHDMDIYICYICHKAMGKSDTTLDHVEPRSSRPDLRYDFSNLRPCCFACNGEKGSKHL